MCNRDCKEGGLICGVENVGRVRILFEYVQDYHRCFSCADLFIKTCWYSLLDSSKVENAPFCIENYMSLQLSVVKFGPLSIYSEVLLFPLILFQI